MLNFKNKCGKWFSNSPFLSTVWNYMNLIHLQLTHAPLGFSLTFLFFHFYVPKIISPQTICTIVSKIPILKQFIMGLVISWSASMDKGQWGTLVNRRYKCDISQLLKAENPAGDSGRASVDCWGARTTAWDVGFALQLQSLEFSMRPWASCCRKSSRIDWMLPCQRRCQKDSWESRPGVPERY